MTLVACPCSGDSEERRRLASSFRHFPRSDSILGFARSAGNSPARPTFGPEADVRLTVRLVAMVALRPFRRPAQRRGGGILCESVVWPRANSCTCGFSATNCRPVALNRRACIGVSAGAARLQFLLSAFIISVCVSISAFYFPIFCFFFNARPTFGWRPD